MGRIPGRRQLLELSERIRGTRTPGLYRRLLRERCGILCVLNQNPRWCSQTASCYRSATCTTWAAWTAAGAWRALPAGGDPIGGLDGAWRPCSGSSTAGRLTAPGSQAVGTALTDPRGGGGSLSRRSRAQSRLRRRWPFGTSWSTADRRGGRRNWPVCVHLRLWAAPGGHAAGAPENLIPSRCRHRRRASTCTTGASVAQHRGDHGAAAPESGNLAGATHLAGDDPPGAGQWLDVCP